MDGNDCRHYSERISAASGGYPPSRGLNPPPQPELSGAGQRTNGLSSPTVAAGRQTVGKFPPAAVGRLPKRNSSAPVQQVCRIRSPGCGHLCNDGTGHNFCSGRRYLPPGGARTIRSRECEGCRNQRGWQRPFDRNGRIYRISR